MTLLIEDLKFSYGKKDVLKGINLELDYGKLICLLGSNGAGKSTLFKCILQLIEKYSGRICVDGENLKNLSQMERAKKLAYIPQEHRGIFNYSVWQIIMMSTTFGKTFKKPEEKEKMRAADAIKKLNIENLSNRGYMDLSGGERQLVLIARALAQNAKILIMDEPTSNLDFGNQIYLMKVVKELSKEGFLVFLSTHNPDFALRYSDEVVIINDGYISASGNPGDVMTDSILSEIYRTDIEVLEFGKKNLKTCVPKEVGA